MNDLISWISNHASIAHWIVFGAALLAGCNIPISIDLLLIGCAVLSTQMSFEQILPLFCSLLSGCILSAWIAYGIGQFLHRKLEKKHTFSFLFSPERLDKARMFYHRYGFTALLVGRFIPFGIRNCLFMSIGMSRIPFKHFAMRDSLACFIWASFSFCFFYLLSDNYEVIWQQMKTFYLFVLLCLAITGIGLFWYNKKKNNNLC